MPKPKVYVVGVGMTKVIPRYVGIHPRSLCSSLSLDPLDWTIRTWSRKPVGCRCLHNLKMDVAFLVTEALGDAGLRYADVQQATASYLYGGSCCGQRALYEVGFTGIPIFNVSWETC